MEDLCLAFMENSVVNMHCDFRTKKVLRKLYFPYRLYDSRGNSLFIVGQGPFV